MKRFRRGIPLLVGLTFAAALTMLAGCTHRIEAQVAPPAMSYGDVITALRSEVPNRQYKTKAQVITHLITLIRQRGVNKPLSKEIEELLTEAGATTPVLDVIRQRSPILKLPPPTPTPTPVQDSAFFKRNGDELSAKGNFALALADYDRAVALNDQTTISTLLNRGKALHSFGSFEKAVSDFDRVIDLDPTNSAAFFHRAASYEKLDNLQEALAGFRRASELDGTNAIARSELDRIQELLARPGPSDTAGKTPAPKLMEQAKPDYPATARNSRIEGKVLVEVEVDEKGRVIDAKAIDGHNALRRSAVNAAKKSKFQAASDGTKPVRGKVVIEFNFKI